MALKDWKKVDERYRIGYIHYALKKGTRINLYLNRNQIYTKPWTVTHCPENNKDGKYFSKEFKTKAQALKFARNYMEKN